MHQVRKLHVTVSIATIIQSPFAFVVIFSNVFDIIVMWVTLFLKKWCNFTLDYLYTWGIALQSLLAQNSQRCPLCLYQFTFCMLVKGGVSSECHMGQEAVGDVHKIYQISDLLKLTLQNNSIDFSDTTYSSKCILTPYWLVYLIFCNYFIKILLSIQFF